jgi:hypothetical protein
MPRENAAVGVPVRDPNAFARGDKNHKRRNGYLWIREDGKEEKRMVVPGISHSSSPAND